jgi:hypothetical protein
MNVCSVRAVVVTTFTARKMIDVLQVIRSGLARLPNYNLSISIRESGRGRSRTADWHAL